MNNGGGTTLPIYLHIHMHITKIKYGCDIDIHLVVIPFPIYNHAHLPASNKSRCLNIIRLADTPVLKADMSLGRKTDAH